MKKLGTICALFAISACGYSSKDSEMIGQVKKVGHITPIFCPDMYEADISLGVIRNGVGSMSSEDAWVYVPNSEDVKKLKQAQEHGAIVKVIYDVKRLTFCTKDRIVSSVEVTK